MDILRQICLYLCICLCGNIFAGNVTDSRYEKPVVVFDSEHEYKRGMRPGSVVATHKINGRLYNEVEVAGEKHGPCLFHAIDQNRKRAYVYQDEAVYAFIDSRDELVNEVIRIYSDKKDPRSKVLEILLSRDVEIWGVAEDIDSYLNKMKSWTAGLGIPTNDGLFDALAYVQGCIVTIIGGKGVKGFEGEILHSPFYTDKDTMKQFEREGIELRSMKSLKEIYIMYEPGHYVALDPINNLVE